MEQQQTYTKVTSNKIFRLDDEEMDGIDNNLAKKKKLNDEETQVSNSQKHDEAGGNPAETPNFYDAKDEGPFKVHVEFEIEQENREISSLFVSQLIQSKLRIANVTDVKKFGRRTVTVYFNSHLAANNLANTITAKELKKHNLKAYIPESYLFVSGVLRGVDILVDLEDLELKLRILYNVHKLTRMTRMDSETDMRVDTNNVKITFRANKLPDYVTVYNTKLTVSPFLGRIKQCRKCLRYGHYQDQCKSKVSKCQDCGEASHDENEECRLKCVFCKGQHSAFDPKCEERQRQRNVKFLMAKNNIGYFEALELHPTYTKNTYSILENLHEFPELPPVRKTYAKTTTLSPRSRVARTIKPNKVWNTKSNRIETEHTMEMEHTPDPLAGPAYNFINTNKTTEGEKFLNSLTNKMHTDTTEEEKRSENTSLMEKFENPAQRVIVEKLPNNHKRGIEDDLTITVD